VFLHVISPTGARSSLDLVALPIWRLELAAMVPVPHPPVNPGEKPETTALGLRMSYVAGGAITWATIASVDVKSIGDALAIAEVGFPTFDHAGDKARVMESAKALYNNEDMRKAADEIIPKVGLLADAYHGILDALDGLHQTGGTLEQVGPLVRGTIDGWQFAITTLRFEPWRTNPSTISAPGASPSMDLSVPAPGGKVGVKGSLGGAPPKDGEEMPGRQSRASKERAREERLAKEKAEAAAKASAAPVAPSEPTPSTPPAASEPEHDA
jgi:hypothetical protein